MEELKLEIDENNLLHEWKGQAQMMYDYGVKLADALEERDNAKAELAVVEAQLTREVHANPDGFECGKVTESTVKAAVLVQPRYAAATKRLNAAQHEARLLEATVEAIGQRKSTLQGMTDLWLKQWHADPTSTAQPAALRAAATNPVTKAIPGRKIRRHQE